jgi:uncharacterized protein YukE
MQVSSPTDRAKIKKMLSEISNSYTRIAAEKDLIKETIGDLSKEFDIPKRTLNKMAKTYHKQSYSLEQQAFEEFEELYENIVETTSTV